MSLIEILTSTSPAWILICFFLLLWMSMRRPADIPPGPSLTLPLLGDIFRILGRGDVFKIFVNLRLRYGDVFSFYIGNRLVIILNGYDVIKKALLVCGDVFSDRPHTFLMDEICERKGIVSTSGSVWKEQRQFAQTTLKMLGSGRRVMEENIQREATALIAAIQQENKVFDPRDVITTALSNVMCSICFGKRLEYNDPTFLSYLHAIEESFKTFRSTQILNFFPWLKHLPGDLFSYKKTMRYKHFVEEEFLERNINIIRDCLDEKDNTHAADFTTAYLREMRQKQADGQPSSMDETNLKQSLGNMFSGGTENLAETMLWAFLFFMKYPKVQERCFKEICDNIGLERQPSTKDKTSVPYVEATILEIMRLGDVTPLAVAHTVQEDTMFMGFRIPKGAIVLPNMASVMKDSMIWKDPDEFIPDRFLDDTGKVLKRNEFIPFSIGPRKCLGEALANMELFLFVTSLLQTFRFVGPDDEQLSFQSVLGLNRAPRPYQMHFEQRRITEAVLNDNVKGDTIKEGNI